MLREKKGITLIALVITIIILLILAGVTIATLFGENGILTKAQEAKEETRGASVQEARNLWKMTQETDEQTGTSTAQTLEELIDDLVEQELLTSEEKDKILGNEEKGIEATGEITIGSHRIIFLELEATLVSCSNETSSSSGFLGNTSLKREEIESISIETSYSGHSLSDENCWDVSSKKDASILAWYLDEDGDGYYEIKIAGNGGVKANKDSSYLFANIGYGIDDTTNIYGLSNLDVKNVTNMSSMFESCGYDSMVNLDLGDNFNTSNVTNMFQMFKYCGNKSITSLNLGNNFDTKNVENMGYMFYMVGYESNLKNLNLGDKFDTRNVTNMESMFNRCGAQAMTNLDLGDNFDTSKVTNMSHMFSECGYTAMTNLNLGDKFNTSNVTNMTYMFWKCGYRALTNLDLGDKFNTGNVTNMSDMFAQCGFLKMTKLDLGENFDTSQVTDMSSMFYNCGAHEMTSLDLGDKFDTSHVTNMNSMFFVCGYTKMTSLNLGGKFNTSSVTNISTLFTRCGYTSMVNLIYEGTVSSFSTNCEKMITNSSESDFTDENFPNCSAVTCTDGNYTLP